VSGWLTEELFDRTVAMAADGPARGRWSARVQVEVTGGPDGDVGYYWELVDGRPVGGAIGQIDHPDVMLTAGWEDARDIESGLLDPNVAYMRGTMKVSGSMAVALDLLELTGATAYRSLRQAVAGVAS
jgi:hypothetical protein